MSEQAGTPNREDVETLVHELSELKEVLRDCSGKLGRIEKRLRVLFPNSFPSINQKKDSGRGLQDSPATMTSVQVLALYSELLEPARHGQQREVEKRLDSLGLGDLALLVKELGAPMGKKPTRTALTKSVMGRLKQSVMLSHHSVRPGPEPVVSTSPGATPDMSNAPASSPEQSSGPDKPGGEHH